MAYEQIALLTEGADITVERLAEFLRIDFAPDPDAAVHLNVTATEPFPSVEVRRGDWSICLAFQDQPYVQEESKEIAEAFAAGRPDRDLIASCRRRISVAADPDPDMDHFNDFLFIQERLTKLDGVILFDPRITEFVEP